MSLYGFPMIWVGRVAKVLAFVGGLVVVLDIIGPTRIKALGDRLSSNTPTREKIYQTVGCAFGFLFWISVPGVPIYLIIFDDGPYMSTAKTFLLLFAHVSTVLLLAAVVFGAGPKLVTKTGQLLAGPKTLIAIRWTSISLIALGFSFDLLTS